MGRDLGHHRPRPSALPRRRRALPGEHRRAARGRHRTRRAVLRRHPARLRGPAHRACQPPRPGGEARSRGRAVARGGHGRGAHALRPRRPQDDQRHPRAPRRRPCAAARRRGPGRGRRGLPVRGRRAARGRRVRGGRCPGHGVADARDLAVTALRLLDDDRDTPISISCGAVEAGPGLEYPGQLLRAADSAQYASKRRGGGQVCTAEASALRDFTGERPRVKKRGLDRAAGRDQLPRCSSCLDGEARGGAARSTGSR